MRLDKYLSHLQYGSRKDIKALVKQKRVRVNGQLSTDAGLAVNEADAVTVDDQSVSAHLEVAYVLNKPAGVVTATADTRDRTVLDLIAPTDLRPGLAPVGRLDKDTTGLLVLTTDGTLAHALLAPKRHVDKVYQVTIDQPLTETGIKRLTSGIVFKDFTSAPAAVEVIAPQKILLTIHEGKFHQVKRMLHAVGSEVIALKRVAMGGLWLDSALNPGQYRALTSEEIQQLTQKTS
ncbi:pseudouridine synthase [Lacticaseibacillus brantae]|uniref:Pseudouridine synthase n=1 Tax=Lacticaseibacillus brantae DSM 23927 TaxID=1423727 RepID=A0A0R2B9M7_9LACO|nr:pseudouridine synthase [Lacticaseibacillus brantae]KRM72307.1 hypothetical protein FC34_GL000007 [Lacticaseibacillus brantae DSM 23927]